MKLNQEQLTLMKGYKEISDAFERTWNVLPRNIRDTWNELVEDMRESFYLDELWDGSEMTFYSNDIVYLKIVLAQDKVIISFPEDLSAPLTEPGTSEKVIKYIGALNAPVRVLPKAGMIISPGGGLCELCLCNKIVSEKQDKSVEKALGFAKCYGDDNMVDFYCDGTNANCMIIGIGCGTPGLTADEVTHFLIPYWWTKSKHYLA